MALNSFLKLQVVPHRNSCPKNRKTQMIKMIFLPSKITTLFFNFDIGLRLGHQTPFTIKQGIFTMLLVCFVHKYICKLTYQNFTAPSFATAHAVSIFRRIGKIPFVTLYAC